MMPIYALYFFLLLRIFPRFPTTVATAAASPDYNATDFILLNCGASSKLNDTSNRTWDGDDDSKEPSISSLAFSASNLHHSVHQVPYGTARFFLSPSTYVFHVHTGPKFLRLYFYPGIYSHLNASKSFFSVKVNGLTLLRNFSASLNSSSSSQPSFNKEFVINIDENQELELTFFPNPNSFAFVNGIEIVSIPDKLYFQGDDVPIKFVNQLFYLKSNITMENLYRLNVGGSMVEIQDDSGPTRGMFRAWYPDDDYIYGRDFGWTAHAENLPIKYTAQTPPYSAPAIVYATSRVTANYSRSLEWRFLVDSGFYYLIRLHFCEIDYLVSEQDRSVFTILINNQVADGLADVVFWTGGTDIPIFRDYITWVPDDGRNGRQDLRLLLLPNPDGIQRNRTALLNGLEIFKVSDSNRILAAPNPGLTLVSSLPKKKKIVIYAIIGSLIAAVSFLIFQQWRNDKELATTRTSGSGVSLTSNLCRYFSLDEIKTATRKFDDNFVIGKGGFGNVYKGLIDDGATTVAIKRLNPSSNQGAREFLTEIETLSKVRHLHLVSLIGYCNENAEMILVYDYVSNGTLKDHLYWENSQLTWKQRLQICLGAARGLHYLHNGIEHAIIHRDVKPTNILLDEKWVAKISDFGLSKMEPANDTVTHISTNVKGTFGYVDPEYFLTSKLTRKSDVYAFGVVLFEVLARRPAVDVSLEEEQQSLARWARYCIQKGKVDRLIDHKLMGHISPASLEMFVGIATKCLHNQPQQRPSMADVVMALELALALQQSTDPTAQVEKEEYSRRNYSDQSDGIISIDDINPPEEESDSIIREDDS